METARLCSAQFSYLLFIYCDVVLVSNKTTLEALTAFPCKQTAANLKSASVSEEWIITNVRTWTQPLDSWCHCWYSWWPLMWLEVTIWRHHKTSWMSIMRCLLISRHDLETACIQRWRCPAITNPSLLWQDRRLQNVVALNIELLWAGAGKLRWYLDIMVKRKPKHSYKLLVLVPMAMVCKM